jgi:hypothetical protein
MQQEERMSVSHCALPGCSEPVDKIVAGRGWCARHRPESEPGPELTLCALDGCGAPAAMSVAGKSMCRYHGARWPFPGLAAAILGLLLAAAPLEPARAGGTVAASVTTSSAQVLAPATGGCRRFILIQNAAAAGGNNIACAFGGAAALNTAGSLQLTPRSGNHPLGVERAWTPNAARPRRWPPLRTTASGWRSPGARSPRPKPS